MPVRWVRTTAVAVLVLSGVVWLVAIGLAMQRTSLPFRPGDALWGLSFLAVQAVGVLVLWRRPRNLAAWYFLLGPALVAVGVAGSDYAGAVIEGRFALPGPAWAALAGSVSFILGLGLLALALYRFPDGRSLGRGWLVVERAVAVALVPQTLLALLEPRLIAEPAPIVNPLTGGALLPGVGVLETALGWTQPVLVGGILSLVSLVVRFRRGDGTTRRQLTWVLYPVALGTVVTLVVGAIDVAVGLPTSVEDSIGIVVTVIFTLGIPAGILRAMTRARLYDIDRLVSRTVAYGVVSTVLLAVYLGLVLGLRGSLAPAIGTESDLAVAASTLVVAALFGPLRRRTQQLVDRRFDRPRLDRIRTIEDFAARLRDEVEHDAVVRDLRHTARDVVGPSSVWVWQPRA